ncbi:uncharacterized protein V1510DRAFT_398726 [Dipodascopsis tothii]|uniref:uncharacterized protein n=1 Tax=Dipodascopsis tothii TaxID=44089 RepID=UPI0034CE2141
MIASSVRVLATAAVAVVVLVGVLNYDLHARSVDALRSPAAAPASLHEALAALTAQVPPQCADPFRQPGFLAAKDGEPRSARWVPFGDAAVAARPAPPSALYPPVDAAGQAVAPVFTEALPPADVLGAAPRNWLADLVDYHKLLERIDAYKIAGKQFDLTASEQRLVRELNWVHGRRLLLMGDSVDRHMAQIFCREFGHDSLETATQRNADGTVRVHGGKHTTASCHLPLLNFTIAHWHIASMYTMRPDWWWLDHVDTVAFEERFPKYYLPDLAHVAGLDGAAPDLVLFQSGLWDERVFRENAIAKFPGTKPEAMKVFPLAKEGRQLVWDELEFFRARFRKFVGLIKTTFPGTPLMYRALTSRREQTANDLPTINMDRLNRHVAVAEDIEVFEWARLVQGFSAEYLDYLHVGHGTGSVLWGQMVLYYLFRAAGGYVHEGRGVRGAPAIALGAPAADGWAECHPYNVHWGGR